MTLLPKISLITPSYNQGQFINQTIRSVLDQNYPNFQYIVIDGGSTDETLDLLHQYDGQIQWVSEPDRGQSHAINKGLQLAKGDVIGFLNSDDLLEPRSFERVGIFFASHTQASWLTGRCRTVDKSGNEIRKAITHYKNFWLRFRSYKVLTVLNYISQPATFWRRSVVKTVGSFNEQWYYAMDYDYWLRIGRHFDLWVLDDYLARFRLYSHSKSGSTANKQFEEELAILRSHFPSSLSLRLHTYHGALIVAIYRRLLAQGI